MSMTRQAHRDGARTVSMRFRAIRRARARISIPIVVAPMNSVLLRSTITSASSSAMARSKASATVQAVAMSCSPASHTIVRRCPNDSRVLCLRCVAATGSESVRVAMSSTPCGQRRVDALPRSGAPLPGRQTQGPLSDTYGFSSCRCDSTPRSIRRRGFGRVRGPRPASRDRLRPSA